MLSAGKVFLFKKAQTKWRKGKKLMCCSCSPGTCVRQGAWEEIPALLPADRSAPAPQNEVCPSSAQWLGYEGATGMGDGTEQLASFMPGPDLKRLVEANEHLASTAIAVFSKRR